MQRQHGLASLIKVGLCAALTLGMVAFAADKADPTGTWKWSVPGRNGGEPRTTTLKLKTEGEKLTGKISAPGRQGAEPREIEIKDGKVNGDEISFTVSREFNGNTFTQKYKGKINGDVIKGKVEFERNGEAQSRDWEAKRGTDKKE